VGASVDNPLSFFSDEGERFSEHGFVLLVYKSDVAAQESLLEDFLGRAVVDGFHEHIVVDNASFLLQHFEDLRVERSQNLTNLTFGDLRRDLKLCPSAGRLISGNLGLVVHADLVLGDVLLHDVVIEFVRLSISQVVVDLSTVGLDNIGFIRTGAVGDVVSSISADAIFAELFLMFPARIFHLHQASSGRVVSLHSGGVEVTHDIVELILADVFKILIVNSNRGSVRVVSLLS